MLDSNSVSNRIQLQTCFPHAQYLGVHASPVLLAIDKAFPYLEQYDYLYPTILNAIHFLYHSHLSLQPSDLHLVRIPSLLDLLILYPQIQYQPLLNLLFDCFR